MKALYRRIDGRWARAEWNGGEGGRYRYPPSAELELFELILENSEADGLAEAEFFLCDTDEMVVVPFLPARKKFRGRKVICTSPDGSAEVIFDEASQEWLSSLANTLSVCLAIAHDGTASRLVWLDDGGKAAWIDTRQRADLVKQERLTRKAQSALQSALQGRVNSGDYFVNPYSFCPLPDRIHRSAPRDHNRLATDGVSGWFDWVLTLRTDLLLPQDQPAVSDELLAYPGASLRGALRSLHEAIAGGCMRVLDESFVPVHRDPMNAYRHGKDRLAIVHEIDPITHAVTQIELLEEVCWVEKSVMQSAGIAALGSGQVFHLDETKIRFNGDNRRDEVRTPGAAGPGTDWVMHLTESMPLRDQRHYCVAVGKQTGRAANLRQISAQQWADFVDACDGSRDMVGVTRAPDTALAAPGTRGWPGMNVRHGGKLVGRRRQVDGWLAKGDTVWLSRDGALKMAVIWRSHGEHPVSERVNPEHLPCSDPGLLCPTCAVFGAIGSARTGSNERAGYRSHVHVGWASTDAEVSSSPRALPPLRSPKPSSGGFYLEAPLAQDRRADKGEDHVIASHWRGQRNSAGEPLAIRGRKFYWHGQEPGGRQQPRAHNADQHGLAQAIPAGTVLRARVSFDNLDVEQLGWLLAAAQPRDLFEGGGMIHLGGGKPLGYGTAVPEIENIRIFDAAERYGVGSTTLTHEQALDYVKALVDDRGLGLTHRALKQLLDPETVTASRINYPTARPFGARGTAAFDKAFEWFSTHSGGREGDLVPLPDAWEIDQYLYRGKE